LQIVATGLGLQQVTVSSGAAAAADADADATTSAVGSTKEAQNFGQQQQQQLLVVSFVIDGSPAAQAGVQEGDAVLDVAGQPVAGKSLRYMGRSATAGLAI
jgi:C-terminal processing protease CtpA/Prc